MLSFGNQKSIFTRPTTTAIGPSQQRLSDEPSRMVKVVKPQPFWVFGLHIEAASLAGHGRCPFQSKACAKSNKQWLRLGFSRKDGILVASAARKAEISTV
jgi:hypothetical protein